MTGVITYLKGEQLQETEEELRKLANQFKTLQKGFLYLLLKCVMLIQVGEIIREIHEGICGSHIGGQALTAKITRAGYIGRPSRKIPWSL